MATYTIDSRVVGPGSGTRPDPWKALASLPALAAGDVVEIACGSTLVGQYTVAASGSAGNPIKFQAYGTGAAPVLDGGGIAGYVIGAAVARSYVSIIGLAVTNGASNGTSAMIEFPASPTGIVVTDCTIGATLGYGIKISGGTAHNIARNTISDCTRGGVYFVGSSASAVNANNISNCEYGVVVDGNVSVSALTITGNLIDGLDNARGKGGIWWSPYTNAITASGWVVRGNTCRRMREATQGIGIRFTGQIQTSIVSGNTCVDNRLHGIFVGGFDNLAGRTMTGLIIGTGGSSDSPNETSRNGQFGIGVTRCDGGVILGNLVEDNGGGAAGYGRGIELSGPGGTANGSKNWLIAMNTVRRSKNRAGSSHTNGTEGVGIGLDDATSDCTIVGNLCEENEGNGIQPNQASNILVAANVLRDNFRLPVPAGLTVPTPVRSEIYLGTGGANQRYFNNALVRTLAGGQVLYGFGDTSTTTNTTTQIRNNIISGFTTGIALAAAAGVESNNLFHAATTPVIDATTLTPVTAVSPVLADPQFLDPQVPQLGLAANSPVWRAGAFTTWGQTDYKGVPFALPFDVGPFARPQPSRVAA